MSGPPSPGRNPYDHLIGDDRNQVLHTVHLNLRKVPGTKAVRYEESGTGVEKQVVADFDTDVFADGVIQAEGASIEVNWWPLEESPDRYWYKFHYYDSTGFDCGWHRQENDHVDGLDHYQERESPDAEYEYAVFDPARSHPLSLLWEIVSGRLVSRLEIRYASN